MKYFLITVKLKSGFEYAYSCNSRMKPGMLIASQSYWTESITEKEITQEEHIQYNQVIFEKEPKIDTVLFKAVKRSSKVVHPGILKSDSATKETVKKSESDKTKKPTKLDSGKTTSAKASKLKMASLEDFFGEEIERPCIPPKKTGRNSKTDTIKKVRARRST